MVRTRKTDYSQEKMQQGHRQIAQPTGVEAAGKATSELANDENGTFKADHIGKRNRSSVFSRFQELPCELRLMVWEAAMTPRLVAVIPRPCPKDRDPARNRKNREISLLRGIPVLLAVNREARHIALRHYTWRFTLDINVSHGNPRSWDRELRRARVVMSPNDTLGLFRCGWGRGERVLLSMNRVQVSNDKRSPWRIHDTTDAPQHGFKKVAILGDYIKSNLNIVRALNVTIWDLDSILHAESAEMRTALSPHTKHKILVESAKMPAHFFHFSRPWPDYYRFLLDRNGQNLDILAYELAQGDRAENDWQTLLCMLSTPR